jgi:hypothetical protein
MGVDRKQVEWLRCTKRGFSYALSWEITVRLECGHTRRIRSMFKEPRSMPKRRAVCHACEEAGDE